MSSSSNETFQTSCDGTCDVSNIEVEEDIAVIEEIFTAINKEVQIGIKQEEIPEDITFPDIKSEPDEVSYVCMSVIRHILPVSSNVSCLSDVSISGQLISSTVGNVYVLLSLYFFWGLCVGGGGLYWMRLSACNC
jgi:hypothetical protein